MDSTGTRYDPVAVALHWSIALMIVGLIPLGYFMDKLPQQYDAYTWHKSFGITVLALSVFRLIWRLLNPPPALPAHMSPLMRVLARASHWLFYFLIIAIPFTGWLMVSASQKYPTVFFWMGEVPFIPLPPDFIGKAAAHQFRVYHAWLAYSTALLLVLHVGAALKHHFIHRDTVLTRMLPLWLQRART